MDSGAEAEKDKGHQLYVRQGTNAQKVVIQWTGQVPLEAIFFQMKGQARGPRTTCRHPREHFVAFFFKHGATRGGNYRTVNSLPSLCDKVNETDGREKQGNFLVHFLDFFITLPLSVSLFLPLSLCLSAGMRARWITRLSDTKGEKLPARLLSTYIGTALCSPVATSLCVLLCVSVNVCVYVCVHCWWKKQRVRGERFWKPAHAGKCV